ASSSGASKNGVVHRLCDHPSRQSSASGAAPAQAPTISQTGQGPSHAASDSADRRSRPAHGRGNRTGPSQPGPRSCPITPPSFRMEISSPDGNDEPSGRVVEDQIADPEDQEKDQPADDLVVAAPVVALIVFITHGSLLSLGCVAVLPLAA